MPSKALTWCAVYDMAYLAIESTKTNFLEILNQFSQSTGSFLPHLSSAETLLNQ